MHSAKFQTPNLLFGLQPTCKHIYAQAFWLCVVHTLNKRSLRKAMFLIVCSAQSSQHRIYFLGLQPTSRSFYTQAAWLCVVHSLNKRFVLSTQCVFFLTTAALSPPRERSRRTQKAPRATTKVCLSKWRQLKNELKCYLCLCSLD